MSSLVERLRVRSEKKPLYNDNESDDDLHLPLSQMDSRSDKKQPKRFVRKDAKEDACQACGENGSLISCRTCTYSFHPKCLLLPRKVTPDSWSCPECVSPLNELQKILDCEVRPIVPDGTDMESPGSKKKYVKQYLVKWKGLSHLHCKWVPEKEFIKASKVFPLLKTRINYFQKLMDSVHKSEDEWVAVRPEWTTIDRILASRNTGSEREYFVKWKELPYDECSWEVKSDISTFQHEIERFKMIQSRRRKKSATKIKGFNRDSREMRHKQKEFQHYDHNPEFLSGGTLHPYQLEGLNFLRYAWMKKTHVILADEMGLGKTIQSIAFLASLFKDNTYPHLVVAPLSTLRNWEREFATWAPEMNVVMYFGSSQARAVIREYEFYYPKEKIDKNKRKRHTHDADQKKQSRIKFDVLLTSYEMINMDSATLKPIEWECMIVDEGHRLKNKESKLFLQLKLYSTKHRVLLTGTPLQNNLDELFMLMHFLDAGKFSSLEDFQEEFKDINQEEQVARLHKMLAPHLLRRVKKDVLKDMPPKKELILRVELSTKQKEIYKAILTRNYEILARCGGAQISLMNVVMELRKLCCHAYMLEGVEPDIEPSDTNEGLRQLLEFSGKMQLLDKMMVKLKEQGHRVLIYSQFQHMLDLLEDYMSYKKWSYERIDGKISGAERQIRIDRFNAKNSIRFCFLLSTRAGGLGINLATADTVIIYDSDWNPHADLQAMARAHRLGQTNKVMIFRLITRGTIEERMMQLTKKKMVLEHLVVGRLKAQTVNQEELDDIIRYGSKELFADESDEAGKTRQIHYDHAAIDRLLNRDQVGDEEASIDEDDDGLLKAFKVANFEYIDEVEAAAAREEEAQKQAMADKASTAQSNSNRADYWDELLKDRYEVHRIEEFTAMGKGKRSRKQMTATKEDDHPSAQDISSEDEDYSYEDDLSETEIRLPENGSGRRGQLSRKKTRVSYTEPPPLMDGEGKSFRVLGFNHNQRSSFLQILMRFGFGKFDWKEFVPRLKGKTQHEIHEYGSLFMSHIREGATDSPNFLDGVPKDGLKIDDLLVRVANIELIEEKILFATQNPGASLFPEHVFECLPGLKGNTWKDEHDLLLLKALLKHGYARWQATVEDNETGLADVIRKELNLPSPNGFFSGDVRSNEGASSFHTVNGTSEPTNGSQSNADYGMYQVREQHRRMGDFVKKRYLLLEKALNAEYCLERAGIMNPCESMSHDPETEMKSPEIFFPCPSQDPANVKSLLKELPLLEPIGREVAASDKKSDLLDMAKLYNGMCRVVQGNTLDFAQAYMGDCSAGSRVNKSLCQLVSICENVQWILSPHGPSGGADKVSDVNANPPIQSQIQNNVGRAATLLSSGDDFNIEIIVESSPKIPAPETRTSPDTSQHSCGDRSKHKGFSTVDSEADGLVNGAKDIQMAERNTDKSTPSAVVLE